MVLPLIGAGVAVITELAFGTDGVVKAANAVAGASKSIGDSATAIKGAFDSTGDASDKVRSIFERNAAATAGAFDKAGGAANPFAAANDRVAASLDRLNAATGETNARLGAIADNTDRSFGRIAIQSAVAAAAMTVTRGIIIDTADAVKAAVPAAFDFVVDAIAGFATGVASAGLAARDFATGGLDRYVTPSAIAAAEEIRNLTLAQGQTAATMYGVRDAAKATGLSADTAAGILSHLTTVIIGTDEAAVEARAAARAYGVELSGLTRDDAPAALQNLIVNFKGIHDSAEKTAAILQTIGVAGPKELGAFAGATDVSNDGMRRANELTAELDLRVKQHFGDEAALSNKPGLWDSIIAKITTALQLGDDFNAQLRLISETGRHNFEMYANSGINDPNRPNYLASYTQSNYDQLRLFASRLLPSGTALFGSALYPGGETERPSSDFVGPMPFSDRLVEPPRSPYLQRDLRPEAPDLNAPYNAALFGRLQSGYITAAEFAAIDPRDEDAQRAAAVQKARDSASAAFLAQFRGPLTEAGQASLGDIQDVAGKSAGDQFDTTKVYKLEASYKALAESLNPIVAANAKFSESQELIQDALDRGVVSDDEAAIATANLNEKYKDALDPLEAMRKKLAEERATLALGSQERRIANELLQRETELRQKGVEVTPRIVATLRGDIQDRIGSEATGRARDALDSGRDEIAVLQRSLELQGGNVELRGREVEALRERLRIEREFPSLDDQVKQDLIAQAALRGELNAKIKEGDEAARDFKQIMRQGTADIVNGFEEAIIGGKKFSEVLHSLEQSLLKLGFNAFVNKPVNSFIDNQLGSSGVGNLLSGGGSLFAGVSNTVAGTGFLGTAIGGSSYADALAAGVIALHDGGSVGLDGTPRAMPRSAFRDAPRFHDGVYLAPDERMAILQTGEQVRSRAQVANDRKNGKGGMSFGDIHVHVPGGANPDTAKRTGAAVGRAVMSELQRQARRNG